MPVKSVANVGHVGLEKLRSAPGYLHRRGATYLAVTDAPLIVMSTNSPLPSSFQRPLRLRDCFFVPLPCDSRFRCPPLGLPVCVVATGASNRVATKIADVAIVINFLIALPSVPLRCLD